MVTVSSQRFASPLGVVFALLAAAALLQSTLLVMVDPGLLGWQPGHGHVFLDGRLRPHHHPWDTPASPGAEAGSAVVFTPGDTGVAGSVAGALTVPAAPIVAPAAPQLSILDAAYPATPPDVAGDVPAPPPRG